MTLGLAVERNNAQSRNKERVGKNFQRKKSKKWTLPYTPDKAISEANKKRFGEKARPDPYNNIKVTKKNHN